MAKPGIAEEAQRFTAIALTVRDCLHSWWHGRCDGKRRIPVAQSSAGEILTPHIETLASHAREVFETEKHRLFDDLVVFESRRANLQMRVGELEAARNDLEGRLQNATALGPAQGRRTGEAELDMVVVNRRRRFEHERQLEVLRTEFAAARKALATARAEHAALPNQERLRREQADTRTAQFSHFTQRRMAIYWRAFLRAQRRGSTYQWGPLPALPSEHYSQSQSSR